MYVCVWCWWWGGDGSQVFTHPFFPFLAGVQRGTEVAEMDVPSAKLTMVLS